MADTLANWIPVKGYEGRYFINCYGHVLSINPIKGSLLLTPKIRGKYLCYGLYKDGKQKKWFVHRLMAIHFIPLVEGKPFVNHKDGNKFNNSIENLEWCTIKENVLHAYASGLTTPKKGAESILYGLEKLNHYRSVKLQCLCTGAIMNIKDAANFLQIDRASISRMVNGKKYNWTNFIKI